MPCHAWPSAGCCDICNTSHAPSFPQQIPFLELAGWFPGINISLQIFHHDHWSLEQLCWFALMLSQGSSSNPHPQFPPLSSWRCLKYLCFGEGLLNVLIISGIFQVIFDSWTISKVCFIFYFISFTAFSWRRIFAVGNLRREKAPSKAEQMVSNGKSLCLPLWCTTAGHR